MVEIRSLRAQGCRTHLAASLACLALAAAGSGCSDEGVPGDGPTFSVGDGNRPQYTIKGTILNLEGILHLRGVTSGGSSYTGGAERHPGSSVDAGFGFGYVKFGETYKITITGQPEHQTCTIANGEGTVRGNVTDILITCITHQLSVGGAVNGLSSAADPLHGVYQLAGGRGYLSFLPNGWYMLASQVAGVPSTGPDSCEGSSGMEVGPYDYDAAAGTLALFDSLSNSSGGCGLWAGESTAGIQLLNAGAGENSVLILMWAGEIITLTAAASVAEGFL
jgi:hypothetical protein